MTDGEREFLRDHIQALSERPDPARARGNVRGRVAVLTKGGLRFEGYVEVVGDWDGECVRMHGLRYASEGRTEVLLPLSSIEAVTWGAVAPSGECAICGGPMDGPTAGHVHRAAR
jgi:hypothetical protein